MRILGITIDERFLEHRRRSTSIASVVGGWVAVGLFLYHHFGDGGSELDHSIEQPAWRFATVERESRATGALGHD